jgi:hypothetical protein
MRLIELSGLQQTFSDQIAQISEQNASISKNMADNIRSQHAGLPDSFYREAQKEIEVFLNNLDKHLDASSLAREYGRHFSKYLDEDEIDELITFYRSPIGAK